MNQIFNLYIVSVQNGNNAENTDNSNIFVKLIKTLSQTFVFSKKKKKKKNSLS